MTGVIRLLKCYYFKRIVRTLEEVSRIRKVLALLYTRLEVIYSFWVSLYKEAKRKAFERV